MPFYVLQNKAGSYEYFVSKNINVALAQTSVVPAGRPPAFVGTTRLLPNLPKNSQMTMTLHKIIFAASLTLALAASSAASAKQTGQVFISSENDNVITVLDGKTQQQIASIAVCKRPRDMRLTRDRLRLIAVCGDDGIAIVVDVASRTVVDKIKLQEGVEIFDLSPDGKKLYFSNEDEAAIVVVDLVAKKIINQIKVGEEPEGVLVTPDGKTLYATSEVAGLVHVIDLASGKIVKNIEVAKKAAPPRVDARRQGTLGHLRSGRIGGRDPHRRQYAARHDPVSAERFPRRRHQPGRHRDQRRRQERLRRVGARQPRGASRYRQPQGAQPDPGRQTGMGSGAVARQCDAVCRQRLVGRCLGGRCRQRAGSEDRAGRARAA